MLTLKVTCATRTTIWARLKKTRGNPDAAVGCWKNSVAINERLKLNAREADQAAERLKIFAD